jgi:hypothetical protein
MDDKIQALAKLFKETGTAHHQAFIEVDGDDPDWAIWYADYLHDKLPAHLGVSLSKSRIIYILMDLEIEHGSKAPGSDWTRYYARALMSRYS